MAAIDEDDRDVRVLVIGGGAGHDPPEKDTYSGHKRDGLCSG